MKLILGMIMKIASSNPNCDGRGLWDSKSSKNANFGKLWSSMVIETDIPIHSNRPREPYRSRCWITA
jgi:hypothetical protein